MTQILNSLMSGGLWPDDDVDMSTDYELGLEQMESEERFSSPVPDYDEDPSDERKNKLENYCSAETEQLPF